MFRIVSPVKFIHLGRKYFRNVDLRISTSVQTHSSDTIFAVSSGLSAQTGVSVVRISGPKAWKALSHLCGGESKVLGIKPRYATLKSLFCPMTKEKLDQALVIWFPGPKSFTGEDIVELHIHGSRAVIGGLLSAMEYLGGSYQMSIRPAERGEFTRRAFDNGKMDLTEVEGLADLLAADTAKQREQALKQMDGNLRKTYERWRLVILFPKVALLVPDSSQLGRFS